MDRTFSKRRYLISTLVAAGAAAVVPGCSGQELPPDISDPVLISEKAPPPISGGTMLVASNGMVVAADSDRDLVWLVNLDTRAVTSVTLNENDEPGRVVEDGAGRVHVALRRSGAVATIDLASAKVIDRTTVCPAPRGLAFDATNDAVHVACAGGELVSLPAKGGEALRTLRLERDLNDVIVSGEELVVTRLRSAEVLRLDSKGTELNRQLPPKFFFGGVSDVGFDESGAPPPEAFGPTFSATVAWRTVPLAGGGFIMSHQRSLDTPVVIEQPGGYGQSGGGCDGSIVHPSVTTFDKDGNPKTGASPVLSQSVLPVDIAVSADSNAIAVAAAGSDQVIRSSISSLESDAQSGFATCASGSQVIDVKGGPVAVGFSGNRLVVQTREPASIQVFDGNNVPSVILLPGISVADTGHNLFHRAASPSTALACASCHPQGREDGHTWVFDAIGARRTQTLGGDILATAPLHWDGDMVDLPMIMNEVFVNRMGGAHQGPRHVNALASWMGTIPTLPKSAPAASESSIQHGASLFVAAKCNTCHSGTLLTNNTTVDVGTDKAFQVPSLLGIANRAPFLHDGRAPTLKARFGPSGGSNHGDLSVLTSDADIDDLVAYMETL